MRTRLGRLVSIVALATCSTTATPAQTTSPEAAPRAQPPEWGTFGVDFASMDRSIQPGDDFWSYVNGTWAKTVEIPADRGAFSQVSRLNDLSFGQVRDILDEFVARRAGLSGDQQRVADYYASLMDQAAIDARGAAPILTDLAPVRSAATHSELAAQMGRLMREWQRPPPLGRMPRYAPSPFPVKIDQDRKDPDRYVPSLHQDGIGLPDREYFLKSDTASQKIQEAYRAHLATMLQLTGVPAAEASPRAAAIYRFERKLAEAHWTRADSRDVEKTYNPWSRADLGAKAPGFDWEIYLSAAGLADQPKIIVNQTTAITAMANAFSAASLGVLKDWLAVRMAKDRALALPRAFQDAEFAFSGGTLGGATAAPARWLQAVELTATAMTDAVSKPYIERHFPPATKAAMDDLVKNLLAAMDRRLANLSWMTRETKVKARAKLAAFTPMIGYPDKWRSYERLAVTPGDPYGNLKRAGSFAWQHDLDRIGKPVDRREWWMMPITANAYANFSNNQIVFPAAYLQAPHFDPHADPAVNYGAIGYVIGHEISHHFDDQGSKYDPRGRLNTWWTDEDVARFNERKAKLVAQYDAYEPLPGLHIRGAQTLGENIADNAGLAIAYDAYTLSLGGRTAPVLDGFTGDQRFFMGRAQVNKVAFREEELRRMVLSGVHSPSKWRTWSVRNHDAWYEAFRVQPGHKLYLPPDQRVRVWE
jgi:putative endopeptidase